MTTLQMRIERLQRIAYENNCEVDWETCQLVPYADPPRQWERGDNEANDPEQADWDE